MEDFTYQDPSNANLLQLMEQYELDRVARDGDEPSRIMNLIRWVHRTRQHDGRSSDPSSRNALNILEVCKEENRGVNCRMLAITLTEIYLTMGYKSRFITCMPMGMGFHDCHMASIVYVPSLGRWIYVDPTCEAHATDEEGKLLGIEEFREALIRSVIGPSICPRPSTGMASRSPERHIWATWRRTSFVSVAVQERV